LLPAVSIPPSASARGVQLDATRCRLTPDC
jgi:hypothetical protein